MQRFSFEKIFEFVSSEFLVIEILSISEFIFKKVSIINKLIISLSLMQAVGNQVIYAIFLMIAPFVILIVYYWNNIKQWYLWQIGVPDIPIDQPHDREEVRRGRDDNVCSICLLQPKRFEVSSTCGHSFCGECLFQIYDRDRGIKMKCPLCRNQIGVIFKCFHMEEPNDIATSISNKIREYNLMFDDNRPLLRRILEFPYVLRRLCSYVFSLRFLIFFLRNIYFIRLIFLVFFYLLLPVDILPERLLGWIGFIDDLFVFVMFSSYIITIVAVQFYRAHH